MTTSISQLTPVSIMPGVCPPTDATPSSTPHYTGALHMRFVKGQAQKLGGWRKILMNGTALQGAVRSIYSAVITDKVYTMLGSNLKLYALVGSNLINITPLKTDDEVTVPNGLDTHFDTLANNPFTTTLDSDEITVVDTEADRFIPGDTVAFSGATAVGGFTTGQLNAEHIIRSVGIGSYTIKLAVEATSSATGGGASVDRTSGLLTVNSIAHGLGNGDRIKIDAATDTGGIDASSDINREHLIRNVQTDSFDIMTGGSATSSVTGGGGVDTVYYTEITAGLRDLTSGQGYGMGQYGDGLYGTALVSANAKRYPRIWFFDSFGDTILATAGEQTGIYRWDGDINTAPTLVPGAPTNINYAFVSDNILVTFGAGGVPNKIFTSDQGNIEQWVASSTNQVFEDNIEGAAKLISHVNVDGTNLLFTPSQCYTFLKIQGNAVWDIKFKENIGIIGPMARVVVKGAAYWMGPDNFYTWQGGNVEVVPSNSSSETTLLNYVFKDINRAQAYKSFAWYNQRFDEIWFHYPSEGSDELDRVARFHVTDRHWTPDTMDRLAAEYPAINLQYPRLIDSLNNFFRHEVGTDDDVNPLAWSLTSNNRDTGTNNVLSSGIVPDSVQTGDISFKIDAFSYPQSAAPKNSKTVTVAPDTEFIALDIDGRFLRYTFSGEELGQDWIMGAWLEPIQKAARSE